MRNSKHEGNRWKETTRSNQRIVLGGGRATEVRMEGEITSEGRKKGWELGRESGTRN